MRRNGDRGLVGGDREILDRGYGFHRTGDRWLPDRWLGMPSGGGTGPPPDTVTGYSLSGPASGNVGAPSTPFTVALLPAGATMTGTLIITPSDLVAGGIFTPATVNLTAAAPSATFTYTPSIAGARTVSCTNNKGLPNPTNLTYNVVTPFSPMDIPGLQGWWKGDSLALNNGDPVDSWPDSSGNNNHGIQTGAARPTFKTDVLAQRVKLRRAIPILIATGAIDEEGLDEDAAEVLLLGKPTVWFQSGMWLDLTTPIPATAPWTTVAVMSVHTYQVVCSLSNRFDYTGWSAALRSVSGPVSVQFNDGFANYSSPEVLAAYTFYIVTVVNAGSTRNIYVNGIDQLPLTSGAYSNGVNPFQTLGMVAGNPGANGGYLAEVLHYNSSLSTTDRQNLENSLKTKYGL